MSITSIAIIAVAVIVIVVLLFRAKAKTTRANRAIAEETPSNRLTKLLVAIIDDKTEPKAGHGLYVANGGSTQEIEIFDTKVYINLSSVYVRLAERDERLNETIHPASVRVEATDILISDEDSFAIYRALKRWQDRMLSKWEAERLAESDKAASAILEQVGV